LLFALRLLNSIGLGVVIALAGASLSLAAGEPGVPAWLEAAPRRA
jgi:hypothetical protein